MHEDSIDRSIVKLFDLVLKFYDHCFPNIDGLALSSTLRSQDRGLEHSQKLFEKPR